MKTLAQQARSRPSSHAARNGATIETQAGSYGWHRWSAALTILVFIVACSRRSGPDVQFVAGRVLLDGQLLAKADVGFNPASDSAVAAGGQTDAKGVFNLTSARAGSRGRGAIVGAYVVTIRKYRNRVEDLDPSPDPQTDPEAAAKWQAEAASLNRLPPESLIPAPYENAATAPLRAEVKKGRNTFTFELSKDFTPAK